MIWAGSEGASSPHCTAVCSSLPGELVPRTTGRVGQPQGCQDRSCSVAWPVWDGVEKSVALRTVLRNDSDLSLHLFPCPRQCERLDLPCTQTLSLDRPLIAPRGSSPQAEQKACHHLAYALFLLPHFLSPPASVAPGKEREWALGCFFAV